MEVHSNEQTGNGVLNRAGWPNRRWAIKGLQRALPVKNPAVLVVLNGQGHAGLG